MSAWYKFNKFMSVIVLVVSLLLWIALAVIFFIGATGYYYGGLVPIIYGIISLLVGIPSALGIFAAWNMLNDWYAKSTYGKSLPTASPMQYGMPMQQQYTYPQPNPNMPEQANMWQCPNCGTTNDTASGFCCNCGMSKQ